MRAQVDRAECIGSGMCTRIVPEVFELAEDDVSRVVMASPLPNELVGLVENAVACCPVEAISLQDEDRV